MSKHKTICLAVLATVFMVGCASTKVKVTALSTLQNFVDSTQTILQDDGYYITDIKRTPYGNKKEDTYSFSSTSGNTVDFTITYEQKDYKEIYYVNNVNIKGCNVSKKDDYNKYCGLHAPIRQVEQLPKDTTIREFSQGKLIFNSVGIPIIITGVMTTASVILYYYIKSQYVIKR